MLAVNFDKMRDKINNELINNDRMKRLNTLISAKRHEADKAHKILLEIYPDYKSGLIGREQYLALKEKYEIALSKLEGEIKQLESEIQSSQAENFADELIASFKKFDGIKGLTRDMVVELIENIFIHENGDIEIRLKCRDELNSAAELFDKDNNKPNGKHESA